MPLAIKPYLRGVAAGARQKAGRQAGKAVGLSTGQAAAGNRQTDSK